MNLIKFLPFCCRIQRRLFPEVQVNAFDLSPKSLIYLHIITNITLCKLVKNNKKGEKKSINTDLLPMKNIESLKISIHDKLMYRQLFKFRDLRIIMFIQ